MTYSLVINRHQSDPIYVNGLKNWQEVTYYLRKKLSQLTIGVQIFKYSSDYKLLGTKTVNMSNICEVAYSLRDKNILL